MTMLYDMHVHLDLFEGGPAAVRQAAAELAEAGVAVFANTLTPAGFEAVNEALRGEPHVCVGLGLHPWWVGRDGVAIEDFERLCASTAYVGEVGLDFGKRASASPEEQMAVFRRIALACAAEGGKLMSIHAVRSADAVLDILEETGCLQANTCIFHWFSDSSDALHRAIGAGCCFSVNGMMLATRRGAEYARQIPADRLCFETDAPTEGGQTFSATALAESLRGVLATLATIKGEPLDGTIADTSARLLAGL